MRLAKKYTRATTPASINTTIATSPGLIFKEKRRPSFDFGDAQKKIGDPREKW
jgi:hypothetical protein